jgi:hypothetical protein
MRVFCMSGFRPTPLMDFADNSKRYLNHIQPVYPILANSKERTVSLLEHCPQSIRNAFLTALLSAVQPQDGDVKRASALLAEWESSENPRSRAINIVHAQTLLLLIIDADWRASPSLPFLLARAVALANTMKLWHSASVEPPSEIDSEDELGVRIWFSLVLMDRWYAAGTGRPALIPDSSVVIPPGLVETVGETCFHLIREWTCTYTHVFQGPPTNRTMLHRPKQDAEQDRLCHFDASTWCRNAHRALDRHSDRLH